MWVLGRGRFEDSVRYFLKTVLTDVDTKYINTINDIKTVNELTEQISKLTIQQSEIEEKHNRREREIEHKLGLEKQRQEQDLELAKKRATLDAENKFLEQKKELFTKEMDFTRDRMTTEVKYLKDMIAQVLDRLPDAKIIASLHAGNDGVDKGRSKR